MLSCMFGLSARSFGQETVFVSSLYSKEWMCNVSPFHTRYDTHTMLKGLSVSRRPLYVCGCGGRVVWTCLGHVRSGGARGDGLLGMVTGR